MIIKCKDIINLLSDFYDNELESEIEQLLLDHIEECRRCLALLNTFEKTLELFHSIQPVQLEPKLKKRFHRWLHFEVKQIVVKKYKRYL
ncbi:MAG: zf-HC2 domain-containing protein [Endomicrobia bacterium]|nr:zf-HC2 domain-containing protein [Endomicrobiia bacterium]